MRELAVYYCPDCGYYSYHQISHKAVCPTCHTSMTELPMSYQNFMQLEHDMRDRLIADQIAKDVAPCTSVVQRLTEVEKSCSTRFSAARLKLQVQTLLNENQVLKKSLEEIQKENQELSKKNQESESTIKWMHDLIWDLTRQIHSRERV